MIKQQLSLFDTKQFNQQLDCSHIKKTCFNCKYMSVNKSLDWNAVFCNNTKGKRKLHNLVTETFPFTSVEKEAEFVGEHCTAFSPK
jgi:hypothetical protein